MSQIAPPRTSERPVHSTTRATVEVRIDRIVAGGYGLGRRDGKVLLVPLTAPGDLVEVTVPAKGSRADLVRLIEPGPDRSQPPCQHYGQCGGCDLMHLSYEAQLVAKADLAVEVMRRIGGFGDTPELTVLPNPMPFGSRVRATWRPADDGSAGYLRRGSRDVVQIGSCPILDPLLEETRLSLRIELETRGLTNGASTSLADGGGRGADIEFTVAGERFRASAHVFFQASMAILDEFVSQVVAEASRGEPADVLELYAGIGLLTVPLSRRVGRIEAVESSSRAVSFARGNLAMAGRTNVTMHEATAERWLQRRRRSRRLDVVLVDPPRTGLSGVVAERLIELAPSRLVYVSCDPATFARDARKVADSGYRLTTWTGFDLFPQTHHLEHVAAFERTDH